MSFKINNFNVIYLEIRNLLNVYFLSEIKSRKGILKNVDLTKVLLQKFLFIIVLKSESLITFCI